MPGRRDPWRWAAASLMGVSALAVVLVAVRAGGVGPREVRTADAAVPLRMDHLAPPLPPPRDDAAMAFDSRRDDPTTGHALLLTAPNAGPPAMHTWMWGGHAWTLRHTDLFRGGDTPPYTPLSATMAGDATDGTVVLVGLQDAGSSSTWTWDGRAWNEGGRAPNVDSLYGATSVFTDTASGHPIVIGDKPNRLDVIWTWDGQGWVTDGAV